MARVRAFEAHEWAAYRALRLAALSDAPDAFGSTWAAEAERGDAHWRERLERGVGSELDLPLVAEESGELVGLAWGRIDPSERTRANLYQMWVAPSARSNRIGRELLDETIAWARRTGAHVLELGVTCGETPARRLYEAVGFEPFGAPEPLRPGSRLFAQTMRLPLVRSAR